MLCEACASLCGRQRGLSDAEGGREPTWMEWPDNEEALELEASHSDLILGNASQWYPDFPILQLRALGNDSILGEMGDSR